jgi:hypothetical protein
MKIILTKETKESFKLFDDIFQFFRLTELSNKEKRNHPDNKEKFQWELLSDLQPLSVTFTTDMTVDWKLVGAGGGVKTPRCFVHYVPAHPVMYINPIQKIVAFFALIVNS